MQRLDNGSNAQRQRRRTAKPTPTPPPSQNPAARSDSLGQIPCEARSIDRSAGNYSIDSAGNSIFTYTTSAKIGMQIVMKPDGKGEVRYPRDQQTGEQKVEYFGPQASNNFIAYNKHSYDGGWYYRYECGARAYRTANGGSGFDQLPAGNGRWTRRCWGPNPEDNFTINGSDKGLYACP